MIGGRRLILRAGVVDLASGVLRGADGTERVVPGMELRLLEVLAARGGEVVGREALVRALWGRGEAHRIGNVVARLRRRIEVDPKRPDHILTTYGRGYRFEATSAAEGGRAIHLPRRALAPVGRLAERAQLIAALADDRIVSVVGPPGIGKTHLAIEAAWAVAADLPIGVVAIDLAHARSGDDLAAAAARALGLALPTAAGSIDRLAAALAPTGPAIALLDNAEGAIDAVREVVPRWLQAAPDLAVLVTSREPTLARSERVIHLGPLPTDDAVALFLARAEATAAPWLGRPEATRAVRDLVNALECVPLAVVLAAGRAAAMTPAALLDRIHHRQRLIATPHGERRQRSLVAALDVSYDLLDPPSAISSRRPRRPGAASTRRQRPRCPTSAT